MLETVRQKSPHRLLTTRATFVQLSRREVQVQISLRESLGALKTIISCNKDLNRIPVQHQRLFYLGREMKTAGRSLEALGVGRFGVHIIHVHNKRPRKNQQQQQVIEVASSPTSNTPKKKTKQQVMEVVDLADSDDEEEDGKVLAVAPQRKRRRVS